MSFLKCLKMSFLAIPDINIYTITKTAYVKDAKHLLEGKDFFFHGTEWTISVEKNLIQKDFF